MARSKKMAPDFPVPQTRLEAAEQVRLIGDIARTIDATEKTMNAALAAVRREPEALIAGARSQIEGLTSGLSVWASANRDALTQGGRIKYIELPTGKLEWRTRPPSVSVRGGVKAAIDWFKEQKLERYLKIDISLDRNAMLADNSGGAASAPGVTIGSTGEDFIVKPCATEFTGGDVG